MFERFTAPARKVIVVAQQQARQLNHDYIGTEHILLGLVVEGEGVAAHALGSLGISLGNVQREVEEIVGRGQHPANGPIAWTSRAKKVLDLSLREAFQLGHDYIGTEHILLALLRDGEGVASRVLVKLDIELNRARDAVILHIPAGAGNGELNEIRRLRAEVARLTRLLESHGIDSDSDG